MARTLIAGPYAFTGTNGVTVANTDSTNWFEQDGATGYLTIQGNAFQNPYSSPSDCCWKGAGTFSANHYASVKLIGAFTNGANDWIGVTLRNTGAAFATRTMYRVYYEGSSGVKVYKIVSNGTPSQVGTTIGPANSWTANDVLSAEAVTNGANCDIIVYKNGTAIGTRTDSSSPLTGGKPGITGQGSGNLMSGDDWEGGDVTTSTDTPLTVTGAQLALAGSDVTLNLSSALVVDGGSLALAGQDVGLLSSSSAVLAVDGASLALEGSVIVLSPSVATSLPVDGAQMALAGSEVPFILEQPYTSGEIALQGSDVLLNSGPSLTLNITPGSIALEGGPINLTIPATSGELVIQGSDLTMTQSSALALVVDAGSIALQGQSVVFDMALWVLPDQIALTGQDVTLTQFVEALVAGQLALQGSSVELYATGTNLPSEIEGGPIEGESDFAHRIDTDYLETSPKS